MTNAIASKVKVYLMASTPILEFGIRSVLERANFDVLSIPEAESAFRNAGIWSSARSGVILKTLSNNALHELSEVRARFPRVPIVGFSETETPHDLVMLRNLGVKAYLGPTSTPADLVDSIQRVSQGESLLKFRPRPMTAGGVEGMEQEAESGQTVAKYQLSAREMEIVYLVCQGASNKETAAALLISENTVKTHIHRIMAKLHVVNRTQAALIGRKLLQDWQSGPDLERGDDLPVARRGDSFRVLQRISKE